MSILAGAGVNWTRDQQIVAPRQQNYATGTCPPRAIATAIPAVSRRSRNRLASDGNELALTRDGGRGGDDVVELVDAQLHHLAEDSLALWFT
jgi:hypothetical protein